jgi:hypothetical protein
MSKIYKTSRGKSIDLDKLKLANENTIAVGNMKINARGDELGPGGQIAAGKNQVADSAYVVPPYVATPYVASAPAEIETQNNAQKLNSIIENLTNPGQAPAPTVPAGRGTLADSVAKTTAVNQELLKPLNKKNGPSRI